MVEIREYLAEDGLSPYARWFDRLNSAAAVKVVTAIHRMEQGNFSNVKGVGAGVYEYRISFGPGYRIYFCKDEDRLVILLAGVARSARMLILRQRRYIGETTSGGNGKGCNHGINERF
jgi:putative addiction module killer protein